VRALFATISHVRDRATFALTYAFGLRVGEIELLDRENIDLQRERIRIHRLKGGLSGERAVFRNLLPLLRQYLASRTDADRALFFGRQGRLKRRQIQNLFRRFRYATEAALPPSRRHVHV
jgi:site-specific recombinase XerC